MVPIECGRQIIVQGPKFVDPRTVVDSNLSVKEESSPFSSPISSLNSGSRSATPGSVQFPFPEDGLSASSHGFGFPSHQLNYFSVAPNPCPNNSYPQTYQGLNITMENDAAYFHRAEFSPPHEEPSAINEEPPTPSPPVRRRGPGRPSKAQSSAQFPNNKRPTGHSAVKLRRQMHNDSAMRSRARLNKALEELWKVIPMQHRVFQPESCVDDNREVCRAVKVEVAIGYLKKLQAQLSGSRD